MSALGATDAGSILPPAGQALQGKAPFRFAVVGDSRGNMRAFEKVLARIRLDSVALILHGGDIVERCDPQQYEWVLHELGEENLTVPFCPIPGNHDVDEGASDAESRYRLYTRAFGPRQYWFSYANALFVGFDDATAHCAPEDLSWLDRTLATQRDSYRACFVFMHVPPRDPMAGSRQGHALREGTEALMNILKRHRVTAVFASHIHSYLTDNMEGIPIYITGGGGATLEPSCKSHHYLLCRVEADGSFTEQKIDVPTGLDTDYPEYLLRVKILPDAPAGAGVLLCVAGVIGVIVLLRRRKLSLRAQQHQQ
jgi:3',5'-cyclic AMP phosphodiesterase CpdA